MKNKVMKQCWVTIFCYLIVAVVAGSNNLKIFRNIDGSVEEVLSKVEVPKGANLTLICQVENLKNKGLINGYVAWFIPSRIHSDLKLKALKNSSNLVLNNVNVNEEGLYVCTSLKFKIFKILHLLVKQSKSAEPGDLNFSRLTKREVIPGFGLRDFNSTHPYYENSDLAELTKKLDKMREDIFKDFQNVDSNPDHGLFNNNNNYNTDLDKMREDMFKEIQNVDSKPDYGLYNNNNNYNHNKDPDKMREDVYKDIQNVNNRHNYELYNNNDNYNHNNYISYENNINNHGHPNTNSFPVKPVALVFGVLFVVFVVFLVIRFCGYLGHNSSINRSNRPQNTAYNPDVIAPRANRCGHASCSRNYLLNPAGACRFHNNTSPTAPVTFDAMDVESPLTHNARNPTTQLDLPPTYSSSTHNSMQNLNDATNGFETNIGWKNVVAADNSNLNLPPSYDEAIGQRNSSHSDTASQNHNANSSSNHNGYNHGNLGGGNSGGGGD